jgi:hypothetical protein
MNMEQIGGIIRTILAAGGGYLVSKGYLDNATMLSLVGAIVTIITGAWSVWAKRGAAAPTA